LLVTAAGNDRSDGQPLFAQPVKHYHQVLENGKLSWEYSATDKHPRDGADGGFHTVLGSCVAKNVLCIGATTDSSELTRTIVAEFSNFGPTLDGRIKPDLVANGWDVLSLSTSAATLYKQRDNDGTSQATPLVAGVAALVIEALKHYETDLQPPAAMVKAVLLHTARALDAGGPSPMSGWGLPDATAAGELLQDRNNTVKMVTVTAGAATVVKFKRTTSDPFRVTAVWTDRPAPATGGDKKALVNDVDTELTVAGIATPLLPWVLGDTKPFAAQQAANHKDNVEIIDVVNQGRAGEWTLTLRPNAFKPGTVQRVAIVVPGPVVP
jgi:subtilisin family serine protease